MQQYSHSPCNIFRRKRKRSLSENDNIRAIPCNSGVEVNGTSCLLPSVIYPRFSPRMPASKLKCLSVPSATFTLWSWCLHRGPSVYTTVLVFTLRTQRTVRTEKNHCLSFPTNEDVFEEIWFVSRDYTGWNYIYHIGRRVWYCLNLRFHFSSDRWKLSW